MNEAELGESDESFPTNELQNFVFEEVPFPQPADRDHVGFPVMLGATWTVTGLVRRTPIGGRCADMVPFTRAIFRLYARDGRSGTLTIRLETIDKLGNYPGQAVVDLSRDVNFAMGATTLLSQPGTNTKGWFRGADLSGTPKMDVAFSATYTTRRNGQVCWSGTNDFRRTINLVRISAGNREDILDIKSQG